MEHQAHRNKQTDFSHASNLYKSQFSSPNPNMFYYIKCNAKIKARISMMTQCLNITDLCQLPYSQA